MRLLMLFLRDSLLTTLTTHGSKRESHLPQPKRSRSLLLRLTVIGNDGSVVDETFAMLAAIYGWFTEGFDTADLKGAKALLD
jgi:hypothetical protein